MRQVHCSRSTTTSATTVRYNSPFTAKGWQTDLVDAWHPVSAALVCTALRIELSAAPGLGNSITFDLLKGNDPIDGGATTGLTITIADTDTTAPISVFDAAIQQGEKIVLRRTVVGTPASSEVIIALETNTYDDFTSVYGGFATSPSNSLANYTNPMVPGGFVTTPADPAVITAPAAAAGAFGRMDLTLSDMPAGSNTRTFVLVDKNFTVLDGTGGTADTTISFGPTEGDITKSIEFEHAHTPGDYYYLRATPTGGSAATTNVGIGLAFTATRAGESHISAHSTSAPSTGAVNYNDRPQHMSWSSTETARQMLGGLTPFVLRDLYVLFGLSIGTGKQYTATLRVERTDPNNGPEVTITGPTLTGSDDGFATVNPGDHWGMRATPASTPTSRPLAWGLVQFIAIPVPIGIPQEPLTPCSPRSIVSNGGKGHSGCNNGGVGWVSSYSGPYGAVPQHDDPADGEPLTGKQYDGIEIWAELHHTEYPSGDVTIHRHAISELADDASYEGGRKREGLLAVGEIENALGNEQDEFQAASIRLEYSDAVDRFFRTLMDGQELAGDEIHIKAATDAARAGLTSPAYAPRILSRGIIDDDPRLVDGLRVGLSAVDILFSDFGPFGPNRKYPSWTFADLGNGLPGAPEDTKRSAIPDLIGEKSDEGAQDPITGELRSKGLLPGIYCGKFTGITGATTTTTYHAPFEEDTAINPVISAEAHDVGPGPLATDNPIALPEGINFQVRAVVNGKWGPKSNPSGTNFFKRDGTRAFAGAWRHDVPNAEYYVAVILDGPTVETSTFARYKVHDVTSFDGTWAEQPWQHFMVTFESLQDGTDARTPETVADEDEWGFLAFGLGAWFRYINIYGSDLGNLDAGATRDRGLLDLWNRGDIMVPGYVWPFPTLYTSFTNPETGRTFWLTGIWVKGPLLDDHINGVVTIAANAIGVEDVGDGTGLPIIDAASGEQWWYENRLLANKTSGVWVTNGTAPQWANGTPMVRSSTFTARQAFTATSYGGRGLTVGWYADTQQSTLECVRAWNFETDTRTGLNRHGQIVKWWFDETQVITDWPLLDHTSDVFRFEHWVGARENVVSGTCNWDPDFERFRVPTVKRQSTAGLAKYKGRIKQGRVIESRILNDAAQLLWVIQRRLARLGTGTEGVRIAVPLMDLDVGDGFLFTSEEGKGADGYVARPFIILKRSVNLLDGLNTYTAWDVKEGLLATRTATAFDQQFLVTDDVDDAPIVTDDVDDAPLVLL